MGQQFVGIVGDQDARGGMVVRTPSRGSGMRAGATWFWPPTPGISTTASELWSLDLGMPMLIINHAGGLPGIGPAGIDSTSRRARTYLPCSSRTR